MTGVHERLLHDLAKLWRKESIDQFYRSHLSPNHAYAKIGGSGSRNIAWMANAIGCYFGDQDCIRWVQTAAERELHAYTTQTHKFRFDCFELFSPLYEGWNWAAEVSAMWFVRNLIDEHGDTEELVAANGWVTRLSVTRGILWALRSIDGLEGRRDNDRLFWKGPGCYSAGLRGKPLKFMDVNQIGVQALLEEPSVDRISGTSDMRWIAYAIPEAGLNARLRQIAGRLIQNTWTREDLEYIDPWLRSVRTAVPVELRLWRDGRRAVLLTSHIEGGNTGALWGTYVTGPENYQYAYPYSSMRIRSGHPELGQGRAIVGNGTYGAHNLSRAESDQRQREANYDAISGMWGVPELRIHFYSDSKPHVAVDGDTMPCVTRKGFLGEVHE